MACDCKCHKSDEPFREAIYLSMESAINAHNRDALRTPKPSVHCEWCCYKNLCRDCRHYAATGG